MCGIAGAINFQKFNIKKIQEAMRHRGPDDRDVCYHNNAALVHTRLAILDLSGGHQPMHYGSYSIVFNGEIYNHTELRKSLRSACRSRSDTETILHLYAQYGSQCLDMMDGMFAFAILDRDKNEIFLARDRAGKKPLYIYQDSNSILFASELNAIKAVAPLRIDEQNIFQYLRLCTFYKDKTPYKNVRELEAGHFAKIDIDSMNITTQKWWDVFDYYRDPLEMPFDEALDTVDRYLQATTKRRLESSDLEVGTFLSGGIDSPLITAISAGLRPRIKTFTVCFQGVPHYDESHLAGLVAQRYSTEHTEIHISFDNLKNDIETIILNYGEPFADSSAVPCYYVSKEAKKYLTVVLNGDGGDELFAGYRRYIPFAKMDFFSINPLVRSLARAIVYLLPIPHEKHTTHNYLYRTIDMAAKKGCDSYLSATIDAFEGNEKNILSQTDYLSNLRADFDRVSNSELSGLRKVMTLDFDMLLTGVLLVKMDIATMAHSLEGRSPLLGKEFLEFSPRLPDQYKIRGGVTKYILRELGRKYLPAELLHQPKRGFEIPLKQWVENDLKDVVFDYLDTDCYSQNFVRKQFLSDLLYKKVDISDEKRAKMLWYMLSLEIWHKHLRN